ncbi:MAG: glycosyltransferase family 2 protein, partial [Deltaproteobacteria bacterium]
TDNTAKVVEEYAKRDKRIVLLRHKKNKGVGGAIATGYKWARDHDFDIAVVMAGDAQMDPEDLPDILDPVAEGKADYSKGNRLFTGEAYKKIPKLRYLGNAALSLLTKIASGYWHIADSQCGYTAANRKVLETIDWDQMYTRYGQPNDLLVKLNIYNFRVTDVPVKPVYNVGERSNLKIRKVIFSLSLLLIKLFFWRLKEKYVIRDFHPLIFFYILGLLFLGLSGGFFIQLVYLWVKMGHAPELTALGMLFSFGIGFQSLFFAMWMDMDYNKNNRGDKN